MTSERGDRLEALFQKAIDLPVEERAALVERECGDDEELRKRLVLLLRSYDVVPTAFLDGDRESDVQPLQAEAMTLGRYTILAKIGEGGMGVVYEAKQDNPNRVVALKVLRPGMASESASRRFDQEAQLLGRLRHPGIAQIYEAGSAEVAGGAFGETEAWPFFAMELIRGVPLDEHVARNDLGDRLRLELVANVCDAVQHAHRNGVIHRDLKPANILVDADGQPKVLDFGVARVTDCDLTATAHTEAGQIVGTLSYMSPEQVGGDPATIDTRTDVYSVGVILYTLLCGRLPHALDGCALADAAHKILHDDPQSIDALEPQFDGDVATIIGKAMEKDKDRRYETIAELAADLRRFLRHEPIVARPPTTIYLLRKFARRHRGLMTSTAVGVLLLVAGLIVAIIGMLDALDAEQRARSERDAAKLARDAEHDQRLEAEAQARRSRRTTLFLQRMLTRRNPEYARGKEVMVADVLDESAKSVGDELADDPEVEAAIRYAIGHAYESLGRFEEADTMLMRALEIRREQPDVRNEDMALLLDAISFLRMSQGRLAEALEFSDEALRVVAGAGLEDSLTGLSNLENRGALLLALDRFDEAETISREALRRRLSLHGADHFEVAYNRHNLGVVLLATSRYDEAEPLLRGALEFFQREFGRAHPATAESLAHLGTLHYRLRRYDEAEAFYRESVEIHRDLFGVEHPQYATALSSLADNAAVTDRHEEAERLLQEALSIREAAFGAESAEIASTLRKLAQQLLAQGKQQESEETLQRALGILRRSEDAAPDQEAWMLQTLAETFMDQRRHDEAETAQRDALRLMRAALGEDHHDSILMLSHLGNILHQRGDLEGTERVTTEVLEAYKRVLGEDHTDVTITMYNLAVVRASLEDWQGAEPLLQDARKRFAATYGEGHPYVTRVMQQLADAVEKLGRLDETRALLGEILERRREERGEVHADTARAAAKLVDLLIDAELFGEAEVVLLKRHGALDAADSARSQLRRCAQQLVGLYEVWGKPGQAATWRGSSD